MCLQCTQAVHKYFPDCDDPHRLLWAATGFPFTTPDETELCLIEARLAGCRTVEEACAYADQQLDLAMEPDR